MTWLIQDLDEHTRLALMVNKQKMRLPWDPSCVDCGETNLWFLRPPRVDEDGTVRCWECTAISAGERPWEDNHIGGQDTHLPPIPLPANLHYFVSRVQDATWQHKTPSGSPAAITIDIAVLYGVLLVVSS